MGLRRGRLVHVRHGAAGGVLAFLCVGGAQRILFPTPTAPGSSDELRDHRELSYFFFLGGGVDFAWRKLMKYLEIFTKSF